MVDRSNSAEPFLHAVEQAVLAHRHGLDLGRSRQRREHDLARLGRRPWASSAHCAPAARCALALSRRRSCTTSSKPAFCRLDAMLAPMMPRPINPTCMFVSSSVLFGCFPEPIKAQRHARRVEDAPPAVRAPTTPSRARAEACMVPAYAGMTLAYMAPCHSTRRATPRTEHGCAGATLQVQRWPCTDRRRRRAAGPTRHPPEPWTWRGRCVLIVAVGSTGRTPHAQRGGQQAADGERRRHADGRAAAPVLAAGAAVGGAARARRGAQEDHRHGRGAAGLPRHQRPGRHHRSALPAPRRQSLARPQRGVRHPLRLPRLEVRRRRALRRHADLLSRPQRQGQDAHQGLSGARAGRDGLGLHGAARAHAGAAGAGGGAGAGRRTATSPRNGRTATGCRPWRAASTRRTSPSRT